MMSLSGLLVACENNQPSKTGVVASPTKTVQPTLQPLPTSIPTDGWQEVVHLGVTKNVLVVGGAFVSTHPYRVMAICEGKGSLKIDFAPQGSTTFICHNDPELQSVDIGSPPKKEQVNVSAISQGSVMWIASVQMLK
jgi:hypothetical protein